VDINAALEIVKDFDEPAACVIKHTNPCGAAIGSDIAEAYARAYNADPLSAYGGIVGLNRPCTRAVAEQMKDHFFECLIAPSFDADALALLQVKKNIRLMETGPFSQLAMDKQTLVSMDYKRVVDGLLIQERDLGKIVPSELKVVTIRGPKPEELRDLLFAWRLCKHVKSNAILLAKDGVTLGVGPGQTNRVGAVEIALIGAGDKARGAVLASDAYFPFRDGLDAAARAGVTAVIQPGGSVRDAEVVAAADEQGLAMVFTGMRHFKH
jgi:phosphoribosylaminoimidazolecarboxamide formyltransferase/IMP cyclohydrolase